MIVNGDWTLGAYVEEFGENLGIGPIPEIVGGEWPTPYTAGKFLMASADAAADESKAAVVADFLQFATNTENQLAQVEILSRLPGNAEAIEDPLVTEDPFLAGSAEAIVVGGIPQPSNLEMRCVFDSMTAGVRDLFSSADADPAGIAANMQSSADIGVAPGGECAPE
jgi:arabinogalactan oligomer/maltooligosaccharide transport system substrate-binding protein